MKRVGGAVALAGAALVAAGLDVEATFTTSPSSTT